MILIFIEIGNAFLAGTAHFIESPVRLFWVISLIAAGFYFFKKFKWAKRSLLTAFLWLFVTGTETFPRYLTESLEGQYPPLKNPEAYQSDSVHILVLGAGSKLLGVVPSNDRLSFPALGRLTEGLRLHQLLPHSKLIFSGNSKGMIPQAELMYQTAISLGFAADRLAYLPTPTTTMEESRLYADSFKTQVPLVLVTCATHMPRAAQLFRTKGCTVIPDPTNHANQLDNPGFLRYIFPSINNFQKTESAVHEYLGMMQMKIRREG